MSARREPTPAEIACHPLFVATLEAKGPLSRPVETIDVERLKGTGPKKRFVFVDWVRAEELPDERALADRFGAGVYKLTAKNLDRNCFIRSTTLEVDGEELEDDQGDDAPAPPAPAPVRETDLLMKMLLEDRRDREKRDEQDRLERERRHERELARQHEHSETLMKTVTMFASSAMQMASGGRGAGMREMLEFANTLRTNESEARIAAIAEREALEETIQERAAANAEKQDDIIDAAFKPIIERVGGKIADKVTS